MQFNRDEHGHAASAAQAVGGHRHGPGAHRRGAAGRALQLRDRPVPGPDQGRGARDRHARTSRATRSRSSPTTSAPASFLIVDGVIPGQRGPRLRAAPHHPPRDPPRLQARPEAAVLPPAGRRTWRASMGEAYPELAAAKERVTQVLQAGGGALRRDAGERHEGARGRAHARRPDARRRDRVPALRHLRLSGRPHRRHRARARRARRLRRLRGGDGAPARARARRVQVHAWRRAWSTPARPTEFHGYDTLTLEGTVVALYREGAPVEEIAAGEPAVVVLDRTPFYAESGGQVGDRGELAGASGTLQRRGHAEDPGRGVRPQGRRSKAGRLRVGDEVMAGSRRVARARAAWNHSATHLMHAALRKVLGPHVQQKGSLVDRGAHALRLLAQRADDRGADARGRGAGERRDPPQHRGAARAS